MEAPVIDATADRAMEAWKAISISKINEAYDEYMQTVGKKP